MRFLALLRLSLDWKRRQTKNSIKEREKLGLIVIIHELFSATAIITYNLKNINVCGSDLTDSRSAVTIYDSDRVLLGV